MANEITASANLKCVSGRHSESQASGSKTFSQTTQGADSPIISVSTAIEALAWGDVSTDQHWAYFHNLDSTNEIIIGPTTDAGTTMHDMLTLGSSEFALCPLTTGIALAARAPTAAVKIKAMVLQK